MDPTYGASEGGLYEVDLGCYECIPGCMEAQGGVECSVTVGTRQCVGFQKAIRRNNLFIHLLLALRTPRCDEHSGSPGPGQARRRSIQHTRARRPSANGRR